jgi:hypothetical protein
MEFDGDDLAGVVDLFGALTRAELDRALSELDFRAGEDDPDDHGDAVRRAVGDYYLVEASPATVEGLEGPAFVAGPVAFPRLPDHATDLPHLLDVPDRTVDREALAEEVAARLRDEATAVAADGDSERAAVLLNVTYDAEAWAPLELDGVRETLDGT